MNLYLVSDESGFLEYWQKALTVFSPSVYSSIDEVVTSDSGIVFILDTVNQGVFFELMDENSHLKFMILSRIPDFQQAQHFLKNGAKGYGNAMMHDTHLQSAFQTIREGKIWLYPDFVTQLIGQVQLQSANEELALHRLDVLSVREREVALLLNQGKSHLEISNELNITVRTIKAHCAAIYEKLKVKDRLALSIFLRS
jgi:DNA-binding NarL/FixJ family response regulator